MSGPQTIEPSGRAVVCSPGCRHPTCVAIVEAEERAAAEQLRAIEETAARIHRARVTELVDRVHAGIIGSPTLVARVDATNALRELAELAKAAR